MSYFREYQEIAEQLDSSYKPFVATLKKIISLTDNLFSQQIDEREGVYTIESKAWIIQNNSYSTQSFTALVLNEGPNEIPYSDYFKSRNTEIISELENAKEHMKEIQDAAFDNIWWEGYLSVLQKGFAENTWEEVEKYFLSLSETSSLFLSLGPIDSYHDKTLGTKKFFSAWLLFRNTKEQSSADTLWSMLNEIAKDENIQDSSKLIIGDLLYSGGEVSKFNSMGWSRPEDAVVAEKYGAVKAIAYNKLQEQTQSMWQAMEFSMKQWGTDAALSQELEQFHKTHSLLPLLLHEFGHTYLKSNKAKTNLGRYYTYIEEARANTNMLHLSFVLEEKGQLPPSTARNIFLRVLFYLKYLHEEYTVRQQREAYYYAALLWLSKAEEHKIVSVQDGKLIVDMTVLDETLPVLLAEVKTFLQKLSEEESSPNFLKNHTEEIFSYGEKITKQLKF